MKTSRDLRGGDDEGADGEDEDDEDGGDSDVDDDALFSILLVFVLNYIGNSTTATDYVGISGSPLLATNLRYCYSNAEIWLTVVMRDCYTVSAARNATLIPIASGRVHLNVE